MEISETKIRNLNALANDAGAIAALAIDQRQSLRTPIASFRGVALEEVTDEMLAEFKSAVTRVLSPYASAVLLDPEYGLEAARQRAQSCGLLLTYEMDGYNNPRPHRMLKLMPGVSVERLGAWGANGIKILLSYTPFDDPEANDQKHVLIERIGNECAGAGIPFLLEFIAYDCQGLDESSAEFARLKSEIVIQSMKEFSRDLYKVDVMKVQLPVDAEFVEGSRVFNGKRIFSYAEAMDLFRQTSEAANRPFVYLSAGVGHDKFTESLHMAAEAGAEFSGVLCGRATWKDGIPVYARQGLHALEDWLAESGIRNIQAVNDLLREAAVPWRRKLPGAHPVEAVAGASRQENYV